MLKIGDFSKLSLVSIKALHYYDELGMLKPAGPAITVYYDREYPEQNIQVGACCPVEGRL